MKSENDELVAFKTKAGIDKKAMEEQIDLAHTREQAAKADVAKERAIIEELREKEMREQENFTELQIKYDLKDEALNAFEGSLRAKEQAMCDHTDEQIG